MINERADEVIEELCQSLLPKYQIALKQQWKVATSSFIMLIYYIKNIIK